ncbi:hypothetical protein K439DRAFT_998124 [Ramaria rubella]|nr:hypothetical protein K439DRAFT_998124 [Ramaria rubella]
MSVTQTATPYASATIGAIYLRPRPYARGSGVLILVPLMLQSPRKPPPSLPAETWFKILAFVLALPPTTIDAEERRMRAGLLRVSKTFKNLASPLFYAYPYLSTPQTLKTFTNVLRESDTSWDSLRRIPYSTPGRWVQALDLSRVSCITSAECLAVDTLLTQLFPITPFLVRLVLNSTVKMSRRAMVALAKRDGAKFLQVLKGVKWDGITPYYAPIEDPLLALVRASEGLEELEVFGPGLQDEGVDVLSATHLTPLLENLIRSPLPSLRHLMVTPYEDVPSAQTSAIVSAHGSRLHTLAFHTPKTWPPSRHETSTELLHALPALQALSLTSPLPSLTAPLMAHPLRILSLPRPDLPYLWKLEAWLYLGLLQNLEEVHIREVKWIRSGVCHHAAEAGVQGDMKEWTRRLARWRVRVLDINGMENAS